MAKPNWISMQPQSGSGNGSSEVSVSQYTGRTTRSGSVIGETTGGASDTSLVTQTGKAEFISITTSTYQAIAAGEILVIEGTANSADLKIQPGTDVISGVTYSLVVNEVPDESWNGNTDIQVDGDPGASAQYTFKISVTIPANNSISERVHKFAVNNANADVTSGEITINQSAGVRTYSLPTITAFTYPQDVPAAGGSVTPNVTYTQTWGWNGSTTGGGTITTGGTLAFTGAGVDGSTGVVTGENLGTTEKERTLLATASVTVILNGRASAPMEATCYQQANIATYDDVIIVGGTVEDIPASGGSVSTVDGISASQQITFTSGSTRDGEVQIAYSSPVTAESLTTTVKARTKVGTLTATYTGEGGESAQKSFDVYQQANQITEYGEITHSLTSPISVPSTGSTYDLEERANAQQQLTYTSGATSQSTDIDVVVRETSPLAGFSVSGTTVTVEENPGAAGRNGYIVEVEFTGLGDKTASIEVTFNQQGANSEIILSPETLEFTADGGQQTLTITSNDSWTLDLVDE